MAWKVDRVLKSAWTVSKNDGSRGVHRSYRYELLNNDESKLVEHKFWQESVANHWCAALNTGGRIPYEITNYGHAAQWMQNGKVIRR